MTDEYLKCPNCGSTTFYVHEDGGGLVFFKVTASGRPVSTKSPDPDLSQLDLTEIFCTGCSWYGPVTELTR